MSNMSYCRFENTLSDLYECLEILRNPHIAGLSKEEAQAAKNMLSAMVGFVVDENLLDEDASDPMERIEEVVARAQEENQIEDEA